MLLIRVTHRHAFACNCRVRGKQQPCSLTRRSSKQALLRLTHAVTYLWTHLVFLSQQLDLLLLLFPWPLLRLFPHLGQVCAWLCKEELQLLLQDPRIIKVGGSENTPGFSSLLMGSSSCLWVPACPSLPYRSPIHPSRRPTLLSLSSSIRGKD